MPPGARRPRGSRPLSSLRLCAIRQEGCAAHLDRWPPGRRPPGDGGSQPDPDDDAPFAAGSRVFQRPRRPPRMRSAKLAQHFQRYDLANGVVVSPDLGNAKSAAAFAKRLGVPMAAGAKERLSDTQVRISMLIGDVRDRDVIVLDDEIVSGGSILELLRHLRDHKARSIRIACTHGILSRFRHPASGGGARRARDRLHGHGSHCCREASAEADGIVRSRRPWPKPCAGSTPVNPSAPCSIRNRRPRTTPDPRCGLEAESALHGVMECCCPFLSVNFKEVVVPRARISEHGLGLLHRRGPVPNHPPWRRVSRWASLGN